MNPVWKLIFFLFNIEGYGEFFSGITPTNVYKRYYYNLETMYGVASNTCSKDSVYI